MAARIPDATVVTALDRSARGVRPVLDLVASDPFGVKARTFEPTAADRTVIEAVLDAAAWVLDTLAVPGTAAWEQAGPDQRARWWVTRIGALNTVAVAAPSLFGILLNRLPLQDLLGFANQTLVLVAVAREYGVDSREDQVDLLAAVLCGRDTDARALLAGTTPGGGDGNGDDRSRWRPFALLGSLWQTAGILRGVGDELHARPHPGGVSSLLSNIPVVGVPARYVGERLALRRAARAGVEWITTHRDRRVVGV